MRTPSITDYEGNVPSQDQLRQMATVPAWHGCPFVGLDEGLFREGENVRFVFVRGTYFRRESILELLSTGSNFEATLRAEPENPHDALAVAVDLDGLHVGYLPRELTVDFQPMVLDGSVRVSALGEITPLRDGFSICLLLAWMPVLADLEVQVAA